jgi:hypothetical protein
MAEKEVAAQVLLVWKKSKIRPATGVSTLQHSEQAIGTKMEPALEALNAGAPVDNCVLGAMD